MDLDGKKVDFQIINLNVIVLLRAFVLFLWNFLRDIFVLQTV
jgi:hypothetical protein